MPRIFYLCHDNPRPSGGIRVLYRHVSILANAGFNAYLVHFTPGFRIDWFESDAPVWHMGEHLELSPDDWIVVPEDHPRALEIDAPAPFHKVVFCQNHFYIFDALPFGKSWTDYGIGEALVSSREIEAFVASVFPIRTTYVPLGLDLRMFAPGPPRRPLSVAFMPRKGHRNLRLILGVLWHRAPSLRDIRWTAIDGLPETEVAGILRDSCLFLATGCREGFGLPPLEAMACGCLPIGFAAGGGRDYATGDNGFWVPDEDPIALAQALEQVLTALRDHPEDPRWERMRRAGQATAARYGMANQSSRLLAFWSERLAR